MADPVAGPAYLDAAAVRSGLTMGQAIEAVGPALAAAVRGEIDQPPRLLLDGGRVLVMAATHGGTGDTVVKTVSVSLDHGGAAPAIVGTVLWFDVSAAWRDEAGPAEACEEVRRIMAQQYAPHRLSTAYRDGPAIAGKTGTFHGGIRNEVGVVDFGDGDRYAVAVFLRQHEYDLRDGAADSVIGEVARLAIDHLRAEGVA